MRLAEVTVEPANVGFLSYAHIDDEHDAGNITAFRKALEGEVRVQTGYSDVQIFQDRDDIAWGQAWKEQIDKSLDAVAFLVPVLTPSFFASDQCRRELRRFLDRERQLERRDLVLPVYWISAPVLDDPARHAQDELARELSTRQYADWRNMRFRRIGDRRDEDLRQTLASMAIQVRDSLAAFSASEAASVAGLSNAQRRSSSQRKSEPSDGQQGGPVPGRPLDRDGDRDELRAALTGGRGGVVVVSGEPGVGKSTIVDTVLADMTGLRDFQIYRHEALPSIPVDVRTLSEDLDGVVTNDEATPMGNSSIARFESTLERLGDRPVAIVIEHAENLASSPNNKLADLDLDEAFEILTSDERHRVTVVLVTSVPLESPQNSRWPRVAAQIVVRGLPPSFFFTHLKILDHRGQSGLAALSGPLVEQFYRALDGNPKNVELAHDLLASTSFEGDARTLAEDVCRLQARDVSRWLADQFVRNMNVTSRSVLDALVAFATPVGEDALVAVLAAEFTEGAVQNALRKLVTGRIVCRSTDEQFFLPPSELERTLKGYLKRRQSELFCAAADELERRRVENPANLADLRFHFAEVDALVLGGLFASAHAVIEQMGKILGEWNRGSLLQAQRIAIQGRIGDGHLEMVNDNALGEIFKLKNDIERANAAFGRAMKTAEQRKDRASQTKLRANLAAMYWQGNNADLAEGYYELAREEAQRNDQPLAEMGALEGLADCSRRWGRYDIAIPRAQEALAVRIRSDRLSTGEQGRRASARAFRCMLKLTRWNSELGRHDVAAGYLAEAKTLADRRGDQLTASAYLDGWADLLLSQGHTGLAVTTATEAVEYAVQTHDPVTLMQARTTLCLAYLVDHEWDTAANEIARAQRYRRNGRALIVLALLGLVEKQLHDTSRADEHFYELYEQAERRVATDERDFAAWDMQCFALCGLESQDYVQRAVAAFRRARDLTTSPTPGLVDRLRFLLARLDQCDRRHGRLQPVIEECGEWSGRGWRI